MPQTRLLRSTVQAETRRHCDRKCARDGRQNSGKDLETGENIGYSIRDADGRVTTRQKGETGLERVECFESIPSTTSILRTIGSYGMESGRIRFTFQKEHSGDRRVKVLDG